MKIGVLALLKNAVPLSTIRVTIPAILYTFTKVAFGTYNLSPSSFEKFSTVENLIKVKTYRLDKANDIMTLQTSAGTYVICEKIIENFKKAIGIPDSATIISTTSAQNHGYLEYCTYNYDGDYAYIGMLVHTDNPRWAVINIAYVL